MSVNGESVFSSAHEQILLQNILIKHDLGQLLAKSALGSTPRNTLLEQIDITPIPDSPLTLSLEVYFNSDLGSFKSLLTYKEFSSLNGVHQHLLLINWLKSRFVNNPKVRIPEILAYGDQYVISEGVQRITFNTSPLSILNKATIAGEILASYHGTEHHPASSSKYSSLLTKTISSLLIGNNRKEKLSSLGFTLLYNLSFLNSGVYGFGNFNTDHILIDAPRKGYIIDPEFIQFANNVDRFEDISNFFVSSALEEFRTFHHIKDTLLGLRTFLRSYNNYLRLFGYSLEGFYYSVNIYCAFYFHLGLNALIKSLFISDSNSSQLDMAKFVNHIWSKGVMFLPEKFFPREFKSKRINVHGFAVSWASIGRSLLENLENDSHFQLIFRRPNNVTNLDMDLAKRHWNFKDKKSLKNIAKELNSWFSEEVVTIDKDLLIYNEELLKSFDLSFNLSNWELISKNLREVYLRKPENKIIHELITYREIDKRVLINSIDIDKKTFSNAIKNLIKDKKVVKLGRGYGLNPNWEIGLNLLAIGTINY
ncbi:MAG: hypothetical protein ACW967_04600 [Candidatus Hodarchaeales archaeon]|jgi:hypothetical protein